MVNLDKNRLNAKKELLRKMENGLALRIPPPFRSESYPLDYLISLSMRKKGNYTPKDMTIIIRILIGLTKYYYKNDPKNFKHFLKSKSKNVTRNLAYSKIIRDLKLAVQENSKGVIRPFDLRERLPDDIKNIQASDLTKIIHAFVRANLATSLDEEDVKKIRKRGRGKPRKADKFDATGRPSYYQYSDYLEKVNEVIAKPNVRKLVILILQDCKILPELYYREFLCMFYALKYLKIDDIIRLYKLFNVQHVEEKIRVFHNTIGQLDDDSVEKSARANARTMKRQVSTEPQSIDSLLIEGAIEFYRRA